MKGTILICLRDMLTNKMGVNTQGWGDMLEAAGLNRHMVMLASNDIPDASALQLFGEAQSRYFKSHEEMCDAFGLYWCVDYAPDIYGAIYRRFSSPREFILGMDQVHIQVTQTIPNAQPPRFTYTPQGANKLLVDYKSGRGLIHVFAGLCRGVGAYFKQELKVEVLNPEQLTIEFPA